MISLLGKASNGDPLSDFIWKKKRGNDWVMDLYVVWFGDPPLVTQDAISRREQVIFKSDGVLYIGTLSHTECKVDFAKIVIDNVQPLRDEFIDDPEVIAALV